ncbi:MAG: hypothetical protein GEU78_06225 [Actinobacteria bacterium]|nr:hypothetical protein [Actinomycetota bacterium]
MTQGSKGPPVVGGSPPDLEGTLLRVPGVVKVHVVGGDAPTEIHVVTAGGRSAKQYVRDVQSLASAELGRRIDYRIISVVQLDEKDADVLQRELRPWIERVSMGTRGKTEWVEVALGWPDGRVTEGLGAGGKSRQARARGAAAATVACLDPELGSRGQTIEVSAVELQSIGGAEWVLVHLFFYWKGESVPLLGSALVADDVASAAARALLDAVNRKLLAR